MDREDDGLNSARGIVNALALSAVFWFIVFVIYWIYNA